LTNLAASPSIAVVAKDGSGTLTTPTNTVGVGSTGNTIVFTYTAPTGGLSAGTVTLTVPGGWSTLSPTGNDPGFTVASAGTPSVSGQTFTASNLTLASGDTLTITYGYTGGGGPGATAPSTASVQTWQ